MATGSPDKLDAVREIIVGPITREWEQKIARLARQIEQLREQNEAQRAAYEKKIVQMQSEYSEQLKRYARRAGQHRSRLRQKLKEMSAQLEGIAQHSQATQEQRLSLAKSIAAVAKQLRQTVTPPAASPAGKPKAKSDLHDWASAENGEWPAKPARKG